MLSTNHKKIIAFYNNNKHLDFEKVNLLFIDLIDSLNKNILHSAEKSLNNEILKDLLTKVDKLKDTQENINENIVSKVDKIENSNQSIFSKVDKIELTQNNMNQNISTILGTMNNIHSFLSEQKNSYISEIRNTLINTLDNVIENKQMSNNEKIQHMLSSNNEKIQQSLENKQMSNNEKINAILEKNQTHIVEKTKLLLSDIFSSNNEDLFNKIIMNVSNHFEKLNNITSKLLQDKNEEHLYNKLKEIVDSKHVSLCNTIDKNIHSFITSNNSSILSEIQNQYQTFSDMNEFLKKQRYCNSSTTGKIGENRLESILNDCFPSENIKNSTGIGKCGDFILERKNHRNKKIIFENKEYTTNVPDVEVKKFIRDIEHTKCHGIFLSQYTGIANKKNFEINFHKHYVLIYLHNVNYDANLILSAVQIIDMITQKIDIANIDTEKISKETIDDIQKDFMLFLKQKNRLVDMSKKYHKEILTMIEEIDLPSISKFLSKSFSNIELTSFNCQNCNRTFRTKRGLASHYKGCSKKTNIKIDT
jgi:hypothetical protein